MKLLILLLSYSLLKTVQWASVANEFQTLYILTEVFVEHLTLQLERC